MLRRLEKKGLKHETLERDKNDPAWTLNVRRGVAAAFEVSWEELSEEAQHLGCVLSLFALAPIPWDLVESLETGQDAEDLEDARIELESLHLLQGENTYRLHQLIREFFQEKLAQLAQADDLKRALAEVMVVVAKQVPEPSKLSRELIVYLSPAVPHLVEVASQLSAYIRDDDLGLPFQSLGWFYEGQGFYNQAEPWYERCLSVTEARFGSEHPDVATSLNNLAYLYDSLGRYSEAEPLYVRALALYKRLLGDEHPDVATSLNNLAYLYKYQGRYTEAESLYVQALELRKRLLGDEHTAVGTSLNNLAGVYVSQGRYSEAEQLNWQALEINKRLLGEEHPRVAASLNNLAEIYRAQGRYDEAEPAYLQALELSKRQLGEEHPNVAAFLGNLANLYSNQGRYNEAQPLYLQALAICEVRGLGSVHPLTIKVREHFTKFLRQSIREGGADLEVLSNNPSVQAILAEVQASLEQSE
jgi:tetratricopeptide (TPR) repeat protein